MRIPVGMFLVCAATAIAVPAMADDAACIAASEAALPLRQQGKLHDSLKQLAACAQEGCPGEVKAECARRIDEIKNAMPTLILAAKDGAGNDLYDVKVSMDGQPLAATLDGRPLSIDPGEHDFVFDESGQPPVEKKLVLREGEHDRREVVVIGPPAPPVVLSPPPAPVTPSAWSTRRVLAVVSGGLGLVGVGLGTSWGLYAISSQNREKSDCASASSCNRPQANEDYTVAHQDATASTVAFVAGGALLAAGAVLWLTAPSVRVAPAVGSSGGGLLLVGDF